MIYYFRWRMANQNLKGGITVNCSFCDKEMQQGKLRTRGENYFVPNGCKTPLLYTKKAWVEQGLFWFRQIVLMQMVKKTGR